MYIEQEKYNEILRLTPIACVDVCILQDNKILLARRNNEPWINQWCVIGGRVRKNEKLHNAVYRKIREETGLECFIKEIVNVEDTIFDTGVNGIQTHTVNICYKAIPVHNNQEVKLNSDHSEYNWFTKEDIKPLKLYQYVLNCINKAL